MYQRYKETYCIARQGNVKEMRSDNGTNLVRAQRELKREIEGWNKAQLSDAILQKRIFSGHSTHLVPLTMVEYGNGK